MKQRAFTRARRADDGDGVALVDLQVYALQYCDIEAAFDKALGKACGLQDDWGSLSCRPQPWLSRDFKVLDEGTHDGGSFCALAPAPTRKRTG